MLEGGDRRATLVAYLAGLLFAVHPVHVEVAAYLVGRAESLATLFSLCALILFLAPMTTRRALAITACTLAAVFSKEQGLLLPVMLLAFVPTRRALLARDAAQPAPDRPALRTLALLICWTLAAYVVFREHFTYQGAHVFKLSWDPSFLDVTINPLVAATGVDRLLLPFEILGHYVQLLVVPYRLTIDYAGVVGAHVNWHAPYVYLGLLTVPLWWVATIVAWRRRAWPAVTCLLGLAISYSIVSNTGVLIGTHVGERLMYMPSVFFLTLVALTLPSVFRPSVVYALSFVLVLFGCVRSFTYARLWTDPLTLYQTLAEEQPNNVRLWMLVTDLLIRSDRPADAADAARRGREADPTYWRIWFYSADAEYRIGHYDQALAFIDHAWKLPITNYPVLSGKRDEIRAAMPNKPTTSPVP